MKSLFDPAARDGILARVEALRPDAPRSWGKMDPAQALAHCALTMEAATGDLVVKRGWPGRILGPLFRGSILGPGPFGRNAPTDRKFVVGDPRDFGKEKARLLAVIRRFAAAGPDAAARREHAFLGPMTGEEWGGLMWKHLDHHLVQFGG